MLVSCWKSWKIDHCLIYGHSLDILFLLLSIYGWIVSGGYIHLYCVRVCGRFICMAICRRDEAFNTYLCILSHIYVSIRKTTITFHHIVTKSELYSFDTLVYYVRHYTIPTHRSFNYNYIRIACHTWQR